MSTVSQRSFTGGEISPSLQARVDFNKYQTSVKTMRNMIALKQGGVQNRPGTTFSAEAKYSSAFTNYRLIPFDAGNGAAYALEFGENYFRVFKDGVQLKDPAGTLTVTNFTWSPAKIFATGSFTNNEFAFSGFAGDLGNILNNRNLKLGTFSGGGWPVLNLDDTPFTASSSPAYTSGGTLEEILEIITAFDSVDLDNFKYAQSVDVLTMVHPDYSPKEILRNSDISWEVRDFNTAFDKPAFAKLTSVAPQGTTGATGYSYLATGVYAGIESGVAGPGGPTPNSYKSTAIGNATLSATNFNRITMAAPSTSNGFVAPDSYNLYKQAASGVYGFIANFASGSTFDDTGLVPDEDVQAPSELYPYVNFDSLDNNPSTVAYAQQRRFFANTNNNPEAVYGSDIGNYEGFYTKTPTTDSDALSFKAAGRKFNPVKHILDLSKLIVMTANSEIVVNPDGSVLTPSNINVKTQSYNGSSDLQPIIINESALYVQDKGNIVRDLLFDFNIDGFSGNDISILANHLFEGYTLVDWCYQQVPNSNVWAVRSDGVVLCLTYLREQQVLAWSRHDFAGGEVESCCSVSGAEEDVVYFIVKRTVNGLERRYIEVLSSRFINTSKEKTVYLAGATTQKRFYNDVANIKIMDSSLSYDGRNIGTNTVTLTGSGWTSEDTLTLTSFSSIFTASDVGNSYFLYTEDQDTLRLTITGYTSGTVVSVQPAKTVPTELRAADTSDYARAVDVLRGLWHLEGEQVSVFSDGFVDASPYNSSYDTITVTDGSITLPSNRAVVHVGLPYLSDLETLAIDSIQSETMIDKKILIQELTMSVEKTRGLWAGKDAPDDTVSYTDGLTEIKARNDEGYEQPIDLKTDAVSVIIDGSYSRQGSTFIRQIDPLPVTILSIHPSGFIPFKGG